MRTTFFKRQVWQISQFAPSRLRYFLPKYPECYGGQNTGSLNGTTKYCVLDFEGWHLCQCNCILWLFLRWFYLRELHESYPFQTDLLRTSHQTRVWGEQWMTFLGNPYVNTRCGQYALSYRLPIWGDLGMRYCGNLSELSSIYALSCM